MAEKTTRERVKEIVASQPELNMTDIAQLLVKSRERIRQIVESEGLNVAKGTVGIRTRKTMPPPVSRVITGGVPIKITHTAAGLIGELLVAADLTARGYAVFFPLTRIAACDLVALGRDGTTYKIEVRCGRRVGKSLTFSKRYQEQQDRFAIVITGEPVIYQPDMPSQTR